AQMKKVLEWSKRETYFHQANGSSDGVGSQPKVPDDDNSNDDDNDDDSNDYDSDDDGNNDASDDEGTGSDDVKTMMIKMKRMKMKYDQIDEELYKDVNVELKDVVHGEERKEDVEITDASHDDKTKVLLQSSSVSYDFASQFLNLDNVPPTDNEIISMMYVDVRHEEPTSVTEFKLKKILIDRMEKSQSNLTVDEHKELYNELVNSYNVDNDLFLVYVVTDRLDWNNPEGKKYPFDLSKTLPLILDRCCQVVPVDYFINNDLEYLRGGSSSKKYTTSTTKTKTAKYDIQGIEDMVPSLWSLYKRNRLMHTDELYKFSDGTLTCVRSVLHDISSNLRMDYLSKRRWSSLDRKRSRIMIKAIDQQLLERRLTRSLEKFVGGRDYGEDLRILQ
nr:hypothetical protein [Tanacetum cinerariifolium]